MSELDGGSPGTPSWPTWPLGTNVHVKLSGLTTEADWTSWQPADVLPYLRHALDVFGPARCLFGSDWPVATLATRYERWWDIVSDVLSDLPGAEREAVMGGNAARVYRIPTIDKTAVESG